MRRLPAQDFRIALTFEGNDNAKIRLYAIYAG